MFAPADVATLPGGSVLTVGVFDGVHLGHQRVLAETIALATELQATPVAITFDRHPETVVDPAHAPRLLTTVAQRMELFAAAGIAATCVLRFDEERSLEEPEDFVTRTLLGECGTRGIVAGESFRFGRRHRGDVGLLRKLCEPAGIDVRVIPLVEVPGLGSRPISSTAIRDALARDDVALVARLLGRPYEVRGVVEHGDARGRELGFPTANVAVPGDIMLPGDGVFAGHYERADGSIYPTAISLGRRPTFYVDSGLRLLEAHLLDFDGNLYGEVARVRIEHWLRGQVRFESAEGLIEQIKRDVVAAREVLGI